jgi:hypothetical protein
MKLQANNGEINARCHSGGKIVTIAKIYPSLNVRLAVNLPTTGGKTHGRTSKRDVRPDVKHNQANHYKSDMSADILHARDAA